MPNLDPWINQYKNDLFRATGGREEEANSKFENYLLSYRDKCQKTIEHNLHQHPAFLQRYQKIIEIIDWTLERYRIVIEK
jgi:hypothetical protein